MAVPSSPQTSVPYDAVRSRIIEAAEFLYDEYGRGDRKPTVEEVRIKAGTGMNATSAVLRDWKMQLTVRPAPVAKVIPESVMEAFMPVLLAAHGALQEEANMNLRTAQANWERERENAEDMRSQLANSWQELSDQIDSVKGQLSRALSDLGEAQADNEHLNAMALQLKEQLAQQIEATKTAEATASEAGRRLDDLKAELERGHADLRDSREELTTARTSHLAETKQIQAVAAAELEKSNTALATLRGRLDRTEEDLAQLRESSAAELIKLREQADAQVLQLRTELANTSAQLKASERTQAEQKKLAAGAANDLAKRFTALQAERDTAVSEAAHTAGQLQALQQQNQELMREFRGREKG
jgi:colicin import membrane protein